MKWYKRDPDAAIVGMTGLTLEECGAYNLIIDFLYSHDGDLADDAAFFCTALHCRPQTWRRLRAALITKRKLHIKTDGKLTANRVETELETASKLIANMTELGRVSAKNRKKNNADPPTGRELQPQPQPHPEKKEERESALAAKRGSRLATDWYPNAADLKFAGELGLRMYEIDREAAKFLDYWSNKPGKAGVMLDWSKTWRNWCRRAIEHKPNGTGNGTRAPTVHEVLDRAIARERGDEVQGDPQMVDVTPRRS